MHWHPHWTKLTLFWDEEQHSYTMLAPSPAENLDPSAQATQLCCFKLWSECPEELNVGWTWELGGSLHLIHTGMGMYLKWLWFVAWIKSSETCGPKLFRDPWKVLSSYLSLLGMEPWWLWICACCTCTLRKLRAGEHHGLSEPLEVSRQHSPLPSYWMWKGNSSGASSCKIDLKYIKHSV